MHSPRLQYEAVRSLSRITLCNHPRASALRKGPASTARPASRTHSQSYHASRRPYHPNAQVAVPASEQPDVPIHEEDDRQRRIYQPIELRKLLKLEEELREEAEAEGLELDTSESAGQTLVKELRGIGQGHAEAVRGILARGTFRTAEQAHQAVLKTLQRKSPPQDVLFTFFRAAQHPDYFRVVVRSSFLREILEAIKPDNTLLPLRRAHARLHPATLAYYKFSSLEQVFAVYFEVIELLLVQHQTYSHEYESATEWTTSPDLLRILLDASRVCGYHQHARLAFARLRTSLGRDIDIESYNKYLEAICWGGAFTEQRFMLRVTPQMLVKRNTEIGTGNGYRTGSKGLRDEVLQTFKQLAEDELSPNATTFENLMIGCAREGDLTSVKFILRNTWNFECEKVLAGAEELPTREMDAGSRLYPTTDTLYAIAHCFCINNDVPAAIRVIDLFSAMYDIQIDARTWTELMEWAFVLSTPRRGPHTKPRYRKLRDDQMIGHLPYSAVMDLWKIMSSSPFNVPMDMTILDFLVRTCHRRHALVEATKFVLEGDRLSSESRQKWLQGRGNNSVSPSQEATTAISHGDLTEGKQDPAAHADEGHSISQSVPVAVSAESLLSSQRSSTDDTTGELSPGQQGLAADLDALLAARDRTMMQKFLRYLLGGAFSFRVRLSPEHEKQRWFHRTLPDIVLRFWRYRVPAGNSYEMPTGRLQFHPTHDSDTTVTSTFKSCPSPVHRHRPNLRVTVEQNIRSSEDLYPYVALTRQERLQIRHRKRSVHYGGAPQWDPIWHERTDVANWDPVLRRRVLWEPNKSEEV